MAHARALRIAVSGAVQGVGFRPFVHRLASRHELKGSVANTGAGVAISVEGTEAALADFIRDLGAEAPSGAVVRELSVEEAAAQGAATFEIDASRSLERAELSIGPDLATCPACLAELNDPLDRRYGYPFINCTQCGPRFSIVTGSPYDRPATTMARFAMCGPCQSEYEDPAKRRFHAQPNACPDCGPSLKFETMGGNLTAEAQPADAEALPAAVAALRAGEVVAVQGLGGFHLMVRCDATDRVEELRLRKRRGDKPFAVMFASLTDLRERLAPFELTDAEAELLASSAAPIVLLRMGTHRPAGFAPKIAPGSPDLGCFLAYTPLHHLLLRGVGVPLVATSGNARDEPIATSIDEVRERLSGLAHGVLYHDRDIVRPVDDSVARVIDGRPFLLRRGRGYAPLSFFSKALPAAGVDLALGAHQKTTVALRVGQRVVLSPHVGDLETVAAREHHRASAADLQRLLSASPDRIACDLHPDYASTMLAEELSATRGIPLARVLHHEAHVRAAALEHGVEGSFLGVAWDGTGLGADGTIHGGEFFRVNAAGAAMHVGSMEPFVLPGGEVAVREPWRVALGLLHSAMGDETPPRLALSAQSGDVTDQEIHRARLAAQHGRVMTSSVGRLFDAASALLGLCTRANYEAEAAVALEAAATGCEAAVAPYPVLWTDAGQLRHRPWLEALGEDIASGSSVAAMALRFHLMLAQALVDFAAREFRGAQHTVVLSGGCFQNRVLLEAAILGLRQAGHRVVWPQEIPCNDGGLAVGQVAAAALAQTTPTERPALRSR